MALPIKMTKSAIKQCLPLQLNATIQAKCLRSWQAKTCSENIGTS